MTDSTQVKLIGGPHSNRTLSIPTDTQAGTTFSVGGEKKQAANVTVETLHTYRLDPHPTEGFILSWVNPADRRRYGG